jgi:uncharacterized protein YbjT (DUF2867 family)
MNVTVFGATGQIGRLVVSDLLAGAGDQQPNTRKAQPLRIASASTLGASSMT